MANLSGSWEGEKLSFNAKGLFIMHGTHDLWTKWKKVPENCSEETFKQYSGPTPSHSETSNYRYADAQTARNAIWYTLDVGVGAKYKVLDNLELSFNMDIITMRNVFNVSTYDGATDIQFIIGAKYECF